MWQFIRSRILMVIIFIGVAHGILVVGPKFIRANQDYTVVISNFNSNMSKVDLLLRMEGTTDDGTTILNITKSVDVRRHTNRMITFNMLVDLSTGNYKITIDGQRGFSFHKEAELVYLSKTISGLIQLDKPVYKPGDTVKFRVIVLDSELKPPTRVKSIQVTIRDSQRNVIRKWSSVKLYTGVFESDLQIATTPMLGMWQISVQVNGIEIISKTFEVKEYVLSSFDFEMIPSAIPLEKHQGLNLTIAANYHFGKPVKGLVKVELYSQEGKLDQKEAIIDGVGQVNLKFNDAFYAFNYQEDVRVKTTFIEQLTNRTVVKESLITVYKYKYSVELIKESPQFRPGLPFKCALQFRYHDGTPARGITGEVEVMDIGYETTSTSDDGGLIKLELNPDNNTEGMAINFSDEYNGFFFNELVDKVDVVTKAYLKLELKSPIKLNHMLQFLVTCNERMTFFVYYIVAKGNIIDSGFMRLNKQTKHSLQLNAMEKMIPKAKIIVATVANSIVVYDAVDIDFEEFRNNFDLRIDEQEVKPGQQIELRMSGRPGAYVGLAAYDKALLSYNANHDLYWQDVMQVFDEFHKIDYNEYDHMLHNMGLFVRTLDDIIFAETYDRSERAGTQMNKPIRNQNSHRIHFLESWLWQNVTIGRSGTRTMIETVPDTATSWYLTGFSIDPEYGLGIIKKPIQFTTIKPFYIMDNLPYSIKRGEAVELQFTLSSNLGREYISFVTLYNVDNQMEFIGRPLEDLSYTKSVSVPPKVVVPVAFLVKARKLGEITVRISATLQDGLESDALEKVIRVMPESLVQSKVETRSFCFETIDEETFQMHLDINKKADNGSRKIEFILNPDLLTFTGIAHKLNDLFKESNGNGEVNMVTFVPNIVVLDYLKVTGLREQSLLVRAKNLLRQGYQNEMSYRKTDGSFAVWKNMIGSVFLTAFVAKSMQTATKYISEVDTAMVEKAYDWLASKQQSSGRFDEVGYVINQDMRGGISGGITLTSYVVTALLENENAKVKHAIVIDIAMNYLSRRVKFINNAYDLSITTYALMLYGHSMKNIAFQKLLDMSTYTNNGMELYWDTTHKIEATAYALQSFVLAEKYLDGILVMRWLMNQRYVPGCFQCTQGTFMGLNALTKFVEKVSSMRNDYTVQLKLRTVTRFFKIKSPHNDIINYDDISLDTKSMEIIVTGVGIGLLQVNHQYSLNLVNFQPRFKLDLEKQNTNSDNELRLNVCVSFISTLTSKRSNMTMIEVTLPSGYEVDQNLISELTITKAIQNIEIRYGGTSVVVYYNNMGIERKCFTVTAYRWSEVAVKNPAYVVVYDYYDPNLNAIQMYE